jgi:hypothetical protein
MLWVYKSLQIASFEVSVLSVDIPALHPSRNSEHQHSTPLSYHRGLQFWLIFTPPHWQPSLIATSKCVQQHFSVSSQWHLPWRSQALTSTHEDFLFRRTLNSGGRQRIARTFAAALAQRVSPAPRLQPVQRRMAPSRPRTLYAPWTVIFPHSSATTSPAPL